MQQLKKIPFFLFLLVLFFCLHGWLENYGFIRFTELLLPGLLIFLCVLLLTGIVYLFTKDLLYASLITFFISLWYLFFGALHDGVQSFPFLSFLKSYAAMAALLLAATPAWIFFLKKKKRLHQKLVLYLNLLLLIYCLIDIFSLGKKGLAGSTAGATASVGFDTARVAQKPDVYLLVFDEYPGFESLTDSFAFANKGMRDYLAANDFEVLPVFSNYDLTYFSMSSILNMQYIKDDFENLRLTQKDFQKRGVEINHAAVIPLFRSMGYAIENLSVFDLDDQPALSVDNPFLLAHTTLLTDKMFHNRLQRDLGRHLQKTIPFWNNNSFYQHDADNKQVEELLLRSVQQKKTGPAFVYAHFMMPHGPYYYDSLGNKNAFEKIADYTRWKDKALFVSYLRYINNRVYKMADTITRRNPGAVVILMGDHGYRSFDNPNPAIAARYNNLCAVRMPGKKQLSFKEQWSTVNLFRSLFNNGFGQNIPYLPDSTVVLAF